MSQASRMDPKRKDFMDIVYVLRDTSEMPITVSHAVQLDVLFVLVPKNMNVRSAKKVGRWIEIVDT